MERDARSAPDPTQLAALRRSYQRARLSKADLAADWYGQFRRWFEQALDALPFPEPNAMVLGTADADGVPSVRTVLLKEHDERGLTFFTNYTSRKGRDLDANPRVSCVFPWYGLERQVLLRGRVERVARGVSEAYFHSRPHGSQIAASISDQSQVIPDRSYLDGVRDELAARYPEEETVPLPDFWGGYLIRPDVVEFWQGRENRLHDRLQYRRDGADWLIERLAP